MAYLRKVLGVTLHDKSTGLKFVKPRMSSHFSESRNPSYVSSAMYPKCPRKEWQIKSFRLQPTPTGSGPKCSRTRWRDYIFNPAWSRLGVEPPELSEIAVDREVFRVLLMLLPLRLSPKENRARKWVNEHECVGLIEPQFFKVC